jgi:amyloid beta precursor protein binding protein 1
MSKLTEFSYKNKARQDASLVQKNVQSTLSSIGREPSSISLEEIELFCRHANFLRAISFRPFSAELSTDDFHKEVVKAAFESWDADSSLVNDYVAFRAFQEFITRSGGRAPGDTEGPIDEDTAEMRRLAKAYLSEVGCSPELTERTENIIGELVRYGGAELHNIASLAGGLVAQEVIKV